MKCSRCQHYNPPGAKFCEECAAPLQHSCANCGGLVSPTAKFCPECAHPLSKTAAAPEQLGAPARYTPEHLAEKILTSKAALEGERKHVTVLFADLKGSMELLADRDPEEARTLLDPVLEKMMEAVHRYEGTVNQVMGDGIMALFGAPLALEDHAVRACYAALRMHDRISSYGDEIQRVSGTPIQLRVGLNSGQVVVRAIGNDLRMDYSAIGQTTHLAARMEQIARPGTTLLTAATLGLAQGYVQVTPLGPIPVKGMPEPVEVYELTGASPVRARLQVAAARGLTQFVGRSAEMDVFTLALERAATGQGQMVALVGEPGVGKSRLVWEFTHSHRTQGWLVFESHSVSYGKATAYRPIIDLLRTYFDVEDRDDERRIRAKVTGKLLRLDEALKHMVPALLSLLDVALDDPEWLATDPPLRRRQTLDACKRLLLRESRVQPLVLIFQDLHWIDTETQALLDCLVEELPTARILLLVNYRPEYQHAWNGKTFYTPLRLDALPPASAGEFLQALLGDASGLKAFTKLLIERTEGNPLFLEETVRALVETGVLAGERGAYRLVKPLGSIEVPTTVQAVLAARIDRLPPNDKQLLQTAAVIGKDVPFALLEAIAELPDNLLRRGLADLQSAEFLYEASLYPDLEFTFKHALTQQVVYQSLLRERRRALHARLVETIETLYRARLADHADRLGHHAFHGEVWNKAAQYLRSAGERALLQSANRLAVANFEQAIVASRHLPEEASAVFPVLFKLHDALTALGDLEAQLDNLKRAKQLAQALGDVGQLARVYSALVQALLQSGDHKGVVEAGQHALDLAATAADLRAQVGVNWALGVAHHHFGRYRRAAEFAHQAIELIQRQPPQKHVTRLGVPGVFARVYLGWSLGELGYFRDAAVALEEAVQLAAECRSDFSQSFAAFGAGYLCFVRGDGLRETIPLLERSVVLCRDKDIYILLPFVASTFGWVLARMGQIREGIELVEEAMQAAVSSRVMIGRSWTLALASEVYLLAGRTDEAITNARGALDLARAQEERGFEAWSLQVLGSNYLHGHPRNVMEAGKSFQESMALAEELGMRPLVAHCHLGLGELDAKTERRDEAREHLRAAATMYRAMDMQFWLEQAEVEMKELA